MRTVADADFETHRPFLNRLAYRMLGSVQDAEDAVQEAYLRYCANGSPALDEPRAWFTRTTTRLCLDRLRRPKVTEPYPGEWLPEPWVDADDRAERDDTLSVALVMAIHRLSPTERAVFLLHDVFGYDYDAVAAMLELQVANCRQLAARARRHLRERPPRPADADEQRRIGDAFFQALHDGNLDALAGLLRDDVVLRADGGGKATAVPYPLAGRQRIVRFFDRLLVRTGELAAGRVEGAWFNGAPGHLLWAGEQLVAAYQFDIADGAIVQVFVQRNPDKLRQLRAERR